MAVEHPAPSAPPAPADADPSLVQAAKLAKLQLVLDKFEITVAEASELAVLQDYNIVLIADDSGSMSMGCTQGGGPSLLSRRTRWDELKSTVDEILELASCLVERIDVFFLNRPAVLNVSTGDARLEAVFQKPPRGSTPLTSVLNQVVEKVGTTEKPVLVLIATDGQPDEGVRAFTHTVAGIIEKKVTRTTFKFQILACTDDDDSIEWLDDFDKRFKEVDVTDDYHSEKKQVLAAGKVAAFTRYDWVAKALLGPICSRFDSLDEKPKKAGNDFALAFFILVIAYFLAFVVF